MAVYTFGSGDLGQLGLGEDTYQTTAPRRITFFEGKNVVSVAAGGAHTLALDGNGTVYSWGCNDDGALGRSGEEAVPHAVEISAKIIAISAGDSISIAIDRSQHVWAWGMFRSQRGILGFSRSAAVVAEKQPSPVRIKGLKLAFAQCGNNHVVGIDTSGNVWTFGDGDHGKLGRKVSARMPSGGLVPSIALRGAESIGAGGYHSLCAQISAGRPSLAVAGLNNYGQAPGGDHAWSAWMSLPRGIAGVKSVKGGEHCTFILDTKGSLWGVGRNDSGQLGTGDLDEHREFAKCLLQDITEFDVSGSHVLAISGGKVFSWGFGEMGQLGYDAEAEPTPRNVSFLGKVVAVGAGGQHSVIVTK